MTNCQVASKLTGNTQIFGVKGNQWAIVGGAAAPQVSDNMEDMRGFAADSGMWNLFQRIFLDLEGYRLCAR